MKLKLSVILLLVFVLQLNCRKVFAVDNELVIAQMNSCVNTLTNIINNKSMEVLEHETDQLLNNLTIQHIVELPEIADFRVDLIDAIGALGITEEEKALLQRINSIRQDNLKWQALSGALSNTMMLTGGGNTGAQLGFQALLTAARGAVEYKTASNEQNIEELQAMWELRKEDMKTFVNLRKEALAIIFSLYQKYNLKESDRLTEQTSQQFQNIISNPDPRKMVRLLHDNKDKFSHLADYYYYLGMGYLDMGQKENAYKAFDRYEDLYYKAPIYRLDEKSGLIALARLTDIDNLNEEEIEKNINKVIMNLPSNSMAIIQCAAVYDRIQNNPRKALAILRRALDSDDTIDKTAIIVAASTLLPRISSNDKEYRAFVEAFNNQSYIDFDAYLNMLVAMKANIWDFLGKTFSIKGLASRPWYRSKWNFGYGFLCDRSVDVGKKITFSFPLEYNIDLSRVKMWVEKHKGNKVTLTQYDLRNKNYVSLKEIEKVGCFKSNPNLKFLYMESTETEGEYRIKPNLDYSAIEREDFPRQSEFNLSEKDLKNIVKFLKKHSGDRSESSIEATRGKGKKRNVKIHDIDFVVRGDSIDLTSIKNTELQDGTTYVKFKLDDVRDIEICYKYDNKNEKLIPCYITIQGKKYFADRSYLSEFGYEGPTDTKETAWYKKAWNWWLGIWDTLYSWF